MDFPILWEVGYGEITAKYDWYSIDSKTTQKRFYILYDGIRICLNSSYFEKNTETYYSYIKSNLENLKVGQSLKIAWIELWWSGYDYWEMPYIPNAICISMYNVRFNYN